MSFGSSSSSSSSSTTTTTNLERFLQSVTPMVASTTLPQSCINDVNSQWQPPCKNNKIEYFTLEDLWNCYGEWSAFGVGTPVQLDHNGDETVLQFYVPYLSAIQIYCNKSVVATSNNSNSDSAEFESDSWSDDSGSDNLSRSLSNNSSKAWDFVSEDFSFELENPWPIKDKLGHVYLQYIETCSPYWRPPLMNKMMELAQHHPALMTLKSVDLSPASWMAVAWYPIYQIPSRKNVKDLSASFLTYHTLSSSFEDLATENDGVSNSEEVMAMEKAEKGRISLPPFGLATYKMEGDVWLKPETSDYERVVNLYSAADSWLKQLNVKHHDFNFFTCHSFML
ncbi:hypothetical protein CsatB_016058 [Cannabis sativa]|uniref:Plant/F9H3-4 protein n=2 Tax=Cannabis sativa TaxID=3483 RepID=A0AB40E6Q4_CANSA|nr:uncharacterized protein LOC115708706 [Cannabis sativa]KAF4373530.1 hypothetical protein F8388_025224 [Cannabis sativa]KAF4385317.1 hypothetical protein G4B88_026600 [Cannabis sativa]